MKIRRGSKDNGTLVIRAVHLCVSRMAFTVMLLAVSATVICQPYYFRHYQVEQGLSHNTVFCNAQDKRGFLWFGTKDGLDRFDGFTFRIFRNDPDDSTSIGDNFIRSLYISEGDTLYVGTRNGLYRYSARKENFSTLYHSDAEVRDIKKDRQGNIWFVSGFTLYRLQESTGRLKVYPSTNVAGATAVCIDANGKVWASTANGLLQEYDTGSDQFIAHDLFEEHRASSPHWIEKIVATDAGDILVGTSNYGVKVFNTRDHCYRDLLTYNPDGTGLFARDFVQVSEKEFWIATESGIYIFDARDSTFRNIRKQHDNPYSISDNAVYSLCRDSEGGIWAGTYFGGANYYQKQYVAFEKFFAGYTSFSLSGNAVREICEDRLGQLWIGTEDAGLNKLDKKTGHITQFLPSGKSDGISYSNIHGLLARGNELWIGTFEHGLDVMDIRTGKVIRHYPANEKSELRSNFIVVIYQTTKGEVYIGTRQGLYKFNDAEQAFEPVIEIPATSFVHSIFEDHRGTLWIGTLGSGLFYFNPRTGQKGAFSYHRYDRKTISSNSITTVFESAGHELWIGTEGAGLCRLNVSDSSFRVFGLRDGFPSNTIFKIVEDAGGRLWITTSNGLVAFTPSNEGINVYTTSHGLLTNQFNYNSGYRDAQGHIYFGSAKGLIRFDPAAITTSGYEPPLFITGLYINDQEMLPNRKGSPLRSAVSFAREVTLEHDNSSFSIDFAALSFAAPEMMEYKYIMEGLDKEWTYLKANRKVYFTNLAPGDYTFKVKAARGSGKWTDATARLVIHVLPPFWASTWAYMFYTLLAAGLILFAVRSYHRRMKLKTKRKIEALEHEKEKEIYQAKINFFTNVAHEIKTPLTLIKAPMEQIAKKAGADPKLEYDLMIMQRNTDRLIQLTNQLLDFRKIETTGFSLSFSPLNISDMLAERFASFKLLADQRNMEFTITLPEEPVTAYVDIDSLQKIVDNLFYNAINYGKSLVQCQLRKAADKFIVIFSNDGRLIPDELREKIFEPFYRMKASAGRSGTGIGLALARSLANLHKGRLYLKEPDKVMNIFVLEMPLKQAPDV